MRHVFEPRGGFFRELADAAFAAGFIIGLVGVALIALGVSIALGAVV